MNLPVQSMQAGDCLLIEVPVVNEDMQRIIAKMGKSLGVPILYFTPKFRAGMTILRNESRELTAIPAMPVAESPPSKGELRRELTEGIERCHAWANAYGVSFRELAGVLENACHDSMGSITEELEWLSFPPAEGMPQVIEQPSANGQGSPESAAQKFPASRRPWFFDEVEAAKPIDIHAITSGLIWPKDEAFMVLLSHYPSCLFWIGPDCDDEARECRMIYLRKFAALHGVSDIFVIRSIRAFGKIGMRDVNLMEAVATSIKEASATAQKPPIPQPAATRYTPEQAVMNLRWVLAGENASLEKVRDILARTPL